MMGIVSQQAMINAFPNFYTVTVGTDPASGTQYGFDMNDPFTPFYGDITPKPPRVSPVQASWILDCRYSTTLNKLYMLIQEYTMALVLAEIDSITIDGNVFTIASRNSGEDFEGGADITWTGVSNPFGTTIGATKTLVIDYL